MLSFDWSFWVRHLSTFASLEARITWMNYRLNTHSLSFTGSNLPAFQLCYFPTKSAPHITIRTFSDYPEFKTPFTSFFFFFVTDVFWTDWEKENVFQKQIEVCAATTCGRDSLLHPRKVEPHWGTQLLIVCWKVRFWITFTFGNIKYEFCEITAGLQSTCTK